MQERRKKMDSETRGEFAKLSKGLNDVVTTVKESTAYHKGLDLPKRMLKVEDEMEEKASWNGLYFSVALVIAIVTVSILVAKGL